MNFLDLAAEDINQELIGKYDVVFNHTTLEHIFKVEKASQNLCLMSKDIVIVIVPFLQEQHAEYGDYWRFTPLTIKKYLKKIIWKHCILIIMIIKKIQFIFLLLGVRNLKNG